MNTEEQVRAAKNPQEALLVIARALDQLLAQRVVPDDPWGEWPQPAPAPERSAPWLALAQELAGSRTDVIESNDGTLDVVIPAPLTEEKKAQRRAFEAQHLKLDEFLPEGENWNEAYAKGGPRWLYYGNRELVMSYPEHIRAAMVEDVIEDAPDEAHEIGRDLLKQAFDETGPGRTLPIGEGQIG